MTVNPAGTLNVYYQCPKGNKKTVLCDTYRTEVSSWSYETLHNGNNALRVNEYPSKLVASDTSSVVNLELDIEAIDYKSILYIYPVKIEVEYDD